ncbi:hypothetical protein JVT61DRAFT_2402 [Boletus reticuloceps]|uniref:Uncharacterized protein n=1 Tax=Boletus reticuloceps TaxID=495285 RepID=A0A8I3AB92_9AGAM|nr:hypothetical protein JVT61DRAFT_2402 [Boletus reticuloceps]
MVRTNSSATVQRPIVIAIARDIGRPFDDDALAAHIISCIGLYREAPQNLGLLCIIPQKTKETVIALNDTLHGIKDILVCVCSDESIFRSISTNGGNGTNKIL